MAPTTRLKDQPQRRINYQGASLAARRRNDTSGTVAARIETITAKVKRTPILKKECVICATSKAEHSYAQPESIGLCAHFRDTCNPCLNRLVNSKVTDHILGEEEAVLACPFPHCDHVLAFLEVKQMVSTGVFEKYILQHISLPSIFLIIV